MVISTGRYKMKTRHLGACLIKRRFKNKKEKEVTKNTEKSETYHTALQHFIESLNLSNNKFSELEIKTKEVAEKIGTQKQTVNISSNETKDVKENKDKLNTYKTFSNGELTSSYDSEFSEDNKTNSSEHMNEEISAESTDESYDSDLSSSENADNDSDGLRKNYMENIQDKIEFENNHPIASACEKKLLESTEKNNSQSINENLQQNEENLEDPAEKRKALVKHKIENIINFYDSSKILPPRLDNKFKLYKYPELYKIIESAVFNNWKNNFTDTHIFERNLEIWRQFFVSVERCETIVHVIDIRNVSLFFKSEIYEHFKHKKHIILLNKCDLLDISPCKFVPKKDKPLNNVNKNNLAYPGETVSQKETYINDNNFVIDVKKSKINKDSAKDEVNSDISDSFDNNIDDLYHHMNNKKIPNNENLIQNTEKDDTNVFDYSSIIDYNSLIFNKTDSKKEEKVETEHHFTSTSVEKNVDLLPTNNLELVNSHDNLYCLLSKLSEKISDIYFIDDQTCFGETLQKNYGKGSFAFIGFPNAGKSSTINNILDKKRVKVSKTPGKTKHLQSFYYTKNILICDTPGIVFPTSVKYKVLLVLLGVLDSNTCDLKDVMTHAIKIIGIRSLIQFYGIKSFKNDSRYDFITNFLNAFAAEKFCNYGDCVKMIVQDFMSGKIKIFGSNEIDKSYDWFDK
ncbi:hypothetical protein EDEG_00441 [Edhazardia aedis USNM 41457]|uniref:G domain-containing protein n=1 Tax=Edhazardia aedis (strain USNM 41457) TaxID=1003232 RepID=J8ZP40_EDHAE|nr:hypothetical protein EDEG_00441 [Edhazardia aedis USNM 41457]|eukprot:EJW01473.1 hypothetical protein EDEG_00441 [Edhazardia aedis USNM 41457]